MAKKKVGTWIKKEAKRQRTLADDQRVVDKRNQYNELMELIEEHPRWKDDPGLAVVECRRNLTLALAVVLAYRYDHLRSKYGRRKSQAILSLERDRADGDLKESLAELVLGREGEL